MANWILPDFRADLRAELEAGMAEHQAEVEAIAAGPWPPTFAETIEALERAGPRLHLAERLLDDASGARSTPEVRALEAELRPRLAAHHDAVGLDPRLFARVTDLVGRRDDLGLNAEQACVRSPGAAGAASTTTGPPSPRSPPCGPNGPACWASPPMPSTPSPSRPPDPSPPSSG
jgi:hypothetical protein